MCKSAREQSQSESNDKAQIEAHAYDAASERVNTECPGMKSKGKVYFPGLYRWRKVNALDCHISHLKLFEK